MVVNDVSIENSDGIPIVVTHVNVFLLFIPCEYTLWLSILFLHAYKMKINGEM